jgi:hypothetical protein
LQHPSPTAELSLATDASDTHIGGVMQQKSDNHSTPHYLTVTFYYINNRYSSIICPPISTGYPELYSQARSARLARNLAHSSQRSKLKEKATLKIRI